MPYTTPPTFVSGNVLSAAQLNIISENLEFLFGLVGGPNLPFNSLASGTTQLSVSNNQWLLRSKHRYLHFKVRLVANDNNDLDIFYNSVRIYHDGTARSNPYTYSGNVDLHDPETWSDWIGAWSSVVTYGEHDIVSEAGVYYASKTNGNLNNQPPDATNWQSLGAAAAFATVGTFYQLYVTTNLLNNGEVIVDYLIEADGTTL